MGTILLLGYAAICVVVFKLLNVPLNRWTTTTACVGGVALIGGIMLGMNYNHPFTTDGRLYFYTTPIVPTVKGRVTEVAVKPNALMKRGDILFQIDQRPYQFVVDQKEAQLAEAEQNVKQLKASYDQAIAAVDKAKSDLMLAQQTFDRQTELFEKKVIAQAAVDTAVRNLESMRQILVGAEAAAERARLAYASEVGGVNTTVARLQADLRSAELDLAETSVTAPTDGYVTQLFLRPGMIASTSTPTMVFIHSDANVFSASFPQNALQRVNSGNEVEVAFDGVPGRVFKGKVALAAEAIALGQAQPSGSLLNPEDRSKSIGRAVVRIDLIDDLSAYRLPAGATAQVAVYTEHWRWVAVIRRIILRMNAWLNFVM
jgi:multidrug resistance efflux pump